MEIKKQNKIKQNKAKQKQKQTNKLNNKLINKPGTIYERKAKDQIL